MTGTFSFDSAVSLGAADTAGISSPECGVEPLAFAVPTEFVELPSRGEYYSEDHPFYKQEAVEIRFMTAKDEDILSSQALLKKGLVIDRLLESLIVADGYPTRVTMKLILI